MESVQKTNNDQKSAAPSSASGVIIQSIGDLPAMPHIAAQVVQKLAIPDSTPQESLWEHSICCAVGAMHIGSALGYQRLEEVFLAGLMHDIGKSVFFLRVPEKMRDVISLVNEGKSFWDAERELLGLTRAEVGRVLTHNWQFPLVMEDVIANQHDPYRAKSDHGLAHMVSVVNSLCHKFNIGLTERPEINPYELQSAKPLHLGDTVISNILTLLSDTIAENRTKI
jgi:HD-like signal output (HDOD) protein